MKNMVGADEKDIAKHRPLFAASEVSKTLQKEYGLEGSLTSLPSDKDQNFVLRTPEGSRFVVKIAHALESRDLLEAQDAMLGHLASAGIPVQIVLERDGSSIVSIVNESGQSHHLRVLSYLEGVPLANVRPLSKELTNSLGTYLGRMDRALSDLVHSALHGEHRWDLSRAPQTIDELADSLDDTRERALVDHFRSLHDAIVEPRSQEFRQSVIHGDANDYNVLVNGPENRIREVVGIIDFGDALHTWVVAEPAVAAAYTALGTADPLHVAAELIAAYHETNPLTENELAALYTLIGLRLSVSICMSAYQRRLEPENDYLVVSRAPALRMLAIWSNIHPRYAEYAFRHACGFDPCPRSQAVVDWLRSCASRIGPVVAWRDGRTVVFDFSVGSKEWSFEELTVPGLASDEIARRIAAENADVGIGRYDEVRLVYQGDQFRTPTENRTVHLGLDLFQPPGSVVMAPLDGLVHSVADNDRPCDYGPTVILEHRPPDGPIFHTLYGHLSRASIASMEAGTRVSAGDRIGEIGDIHENGGWAPHLHFQIIADPLDYAGDFPGVAPPSRREVWLSLSPNPQLITDHGAGARAPRVIKEEISRHRDRRIGPSLRVSYRHPLDASRGYGQYLYDGDGRRYLDTVNNVAHVGHCHPRVVEAVARSMAVLNTNTRYLYDELTAYAERLAATLPEPLEVCYIVNSGSEANDLALRLARAYTGRRDVVVVDHAYHGNLSSLIDISPYKFDGPGGGGRPDFTHVIPMPDPLRGSSELTDGLAIIRDVADRTAAVIAESAMSCGGQIFYPEGFLKEVFAAVRDGGGLTIADEVQTGFGRVGASFWAFELQNVVPDVVTMGKPIGNGYPLGAVVTRREIAQSFDNGMEYFNTFGGNPVACSAGLAVLDVLDGEHLQANAQKVGRYLIDRLDDLAGRRAVIGDVRGAGFFIGVELVRDRETNTPAGEEAAYVVERMRELGILTSVDGPYHNVIKIKPPMVFEESDADVYAEALGEVLEEDFVRARLR